MDYDSLARSYDSLYGEEQLKKANLIKKNISVKKTHLLLDVGCGTGIVSSVFSCNKIGIDPSAKLIKQALMPTIKGNAENLPFGNETFDFVLCVTAIHNFNDQEKGILEMKRVLKKKGTLVISSLKKSEKFKKIDELIRKHLLVGNETSEEKDRIYFCKKS